MNKKMCMNCEEEPASPIFDNMFCSIDCAIDSQNESNQKQDLEMASSIEV